MSSSKSTAAEPAAAHFARRRLAENSSPSRGQWAWPLVSILTIATVHWPWISLRLTEEAGKSSEFEFWSSRLAVFTFHAAICHFLISRATVAWPVHGIATLMLSANRHTVMYVRRSSLMQALTLSLVIYGVILLVDRIIQRHAIHRCVTKLLSPLCSIAAWSLGKSGTFGIPWTSVVALLAVSAAISTALSPSDAFDAFTVFDASGALPTWGLPYAAACWGAAAMAGIWDTLYWGFHEPANVLLQVEQELAMTGKLNSIDRAYEATTRIRGVYHDNTGGSRICVALLVVGSALFSHEVWCARDFARTADPLLAWRSSMKAVEDKLSQNRAFAAHGILDSLPQDAGKDALSALRFCGAKFAALAMDESNLVHTDVSDTLLACGACIQDPQRWNETCAATTQLSLHEQNRSSTSSEDMNVFRYESDAQDAIHAVCHVCSNTTRLRSTLAADPHVWVAAVKRAILTRDVTLARSCCNLGNEEILPEDWLSQAISLGKAGLFENAIALIEQGLKKDPSSTEAWLHLGQLRVAVGRLASAELAYRRGLRLDSKDPELLKQSALVASERGRLEDARESYGKAFEVYVDQGMFREAASVHADLCYAMLFNDALEDAANCSIPLDAALEQSPASIFNHRGIAKARLGDSTSAAESFQEAKERSWTLLMASSAAYSVTSHADAFNNLGTLAWTEQRTLEARDYFEKALQVQGDHPHALKNLRNLEEALLPRPII